MYICHYWDKWKPSHLIIWQILFMLFIYFIAGFPLFADNKQAFEDEQRIEWKFTEICTFSWMLYIIFLYIVYSLIVYRPAIIIFSDRIELHRYKLGKLHYLKEYTLVNIDQIEVFCHEDYRLHLKKDNDVNDIIRIDISFIYYGGCKDRAQFLIGIKKLEPAIRVVLDKDAQILLKQNSDNEMV